MFSIRVGRDAFVQASVWDELREHGDGEVWMSYDFSLRKRYKDAKTGMWKSLYGFDPADTYALLAVVQLANAFIAAQREEMPSE